MVRFFFEKEDVYLYKKNLKIYLKKKNNSWI